MTARRSMWIAVPVLLVMIGFIVVLAMSDPSGSRTAASPLLGRQAPAVSGETIDGATFDLADHRGEWVLLNVFATWCTPCIQEHPELLNFQKRHALAGDATVVSIVYNDRPADARDFFAQRGGDWPVVTDPDSRIAVSYGVTGVPESYLIGPDGTVVSKFTGGVTASQLDQVLAQAQQAVG